MRFILEFELCIIYSFDRDINCRQCCIKTTLMLELCYQDCAVGLLFALLPVLGGGGGVMSGLVSMSRS